MGFTDFTLSFTDNSSGVKDENGTEVQIFTDSPSFVPNIAVDYAYAPHAWMSLPFVNAGVTSIPIRLQNPVTFVRVRVRQFNSNGNGVWNSPGGGAGEFFSFPANIATNTPDAPSNVGLIVVSTPINPPSPPVVPPISPPPQGGTTTTYNYLNQFSGIQGQSGWSYLDSAGANQTYDPNTQLWTGSESYLSTFDWGFHPGTTKGAVIRWTAPNAGVATITGSAHLLTASFGITLTIKHNSTTIYGGQSMVDTTVYQFAPSNRTMAQGDFIDFICMPNNVNNSYCSTGISISIAFTTNGSTPTNPTVSNVSPSTLSVYTNSVTSLTVNLTSAALVNSTISLSSNNAAATVLASIVIPAGQSSGNFNVTGVSVGSATITATYNSTSATCAVTVSSPPVGGQWPNEPAGMTLVSDSSFSDSLGSEWENVYHTEAYASPNIGGQSFSPPRCFDSYRGVGTYYGNGQWVLNIPASSEAYLGVYWGTNAGFQGYSNNTNKMFFVRNAVIDASFIVWQGLQDAPKVLKWYQQGQYNNTHIPTVFNTNYPTDGTGWFENNINEAAATYTAGQPMRFIELYLKKSTTVSSKDGIIKWWVNGTLCGSYTNANLCPPGFADMQINQAWDGSVDPTMDLNRSWHHYIDHLRFSRR